jgi:hypothetical protein
MQNQSGHHSNKDGLPENAQTKAIRGNGSTDSGSANRNREDCDREVRPAPAGGMRLTRRGAELLGRYDAIMQAHDPAAAVEDDAAARDARDAVRRDRAVLLIDDFAAASNASGWIPDALHRLGDLWEAVDNRYAGCESVADDDIPVVERLAESLRAAVEGAEHLVAGRGRRSLNGKPYTIGELLTLESLDDTARPLRDRREVARLLRERGVDLDVPIGPQEHLATFEPDLADVAAGPIEPDDELRREIAAFRSANRERAQTAGDSRIGDSAADRTGPSSAPPVPPAVDSGSDHPPRDRDRKPAARERLTREGAGLLSELAAIREAHDPDAAGDNDELRLAIRLDRARALVDHGMADRGSKAELDFRWAHHAVEHFGADLAYDLYESLYDVADLDEAGIVAVERFADAMEAAIRATDALRLVRPQRRLSPSEILASPRRIRQHMRRVLAMLNAGCDPFKAPTVDQATRAQCRAIEAEPGADRADSETREHYSAIDFKTGRRLALELAEADAAGDRERVREIAAEIAHRTSRDAPSDVDGDKATAAAGSATEIAPTGSVDLPLRLTTRGATLIGRLDALIESHDRATQANGADGDALQRDLRWQLAGDPNWCGDALCHLASIERDWVAVRISGDEHDHLGADDHAAIVDFASALRGAIVAADRLIAGRPPLKHDVSAGFLYTDELEFHVGCVMAEARQIREITGGEPRDLTGAELWKMRGFDDVHAAPIRADDHGDGTAEAIGDRERGAAASGGA